MLAVTEGCGTRNHAGDSDTLSFVAVLLLILQFVVFCQEKLLPDPAGSIPAPSVPFAVFVLVNVSRTVIGINR
jgi:hypothetical protein